MTVRQLIGGYSLYELIITKVEVDAIFHAVHLARKESIVRRRAVTLCPSVDSENCTAGFDWSDGWIMFANLDRDAPAMRDAGEPLLQRFSLNLI